MPSYAKNIPTPELFVWNHTMDAPCLQLSQIILSLLIGPHCSLAISSLEANSSKTDLQCVICSFSQFLIQCPLLVTGETEVQFSKIGNEVKSFLKLFCHVPSWPRRGWAWCPACWPTGACCPGHLVRMRRERELDFRQNYVKRILLHKPEILHILSYLIYNVSVFFLSIPLYKLSNFLISLPPLFLVVYLHICR